MARISGILARAPGGPIPGAVPGLTAVAVRLDSPADHVCSPIAAVPAISRLDPEGRHGDDPSARPARRGAGLAGPSGGLGPRSTGRPAAAGMPRRWRRRVGSTGRVIGLDRDPAMLDLAAQAVGGLPVTLVHAPYAEMAAGAGGTGDRSRAGRAAGPGALVRPARLGGRGFSFAADGPLDMRFDPDAGGPTRRRPGQPPVGRGAGRPVLRVRRGAVQPADRPPDRRGRGRRSRSGPPASSPSWCAGASPAGSGTGRSTRPPGSSRPCGSRSTTSSASSTPRSAICPRSWPRAAGPRSSASTRWKTAGSSGRSRPIRG